MSKFLKILFTFLFFSLLLMGALSFINYFLLKKAFNPHNFSVNYKTIILGDSHAVTGINPVLIPNSINFSNHSENPFYTYYKLKWILQTKSSIDNVILTIGPHELMEGNSDEERTREQIFPAFMAIIDSPLTRFSIPNLEFFENYLHFRLGLLSFQSRNYSVYALSNDFRIENCEFLGAFEGRNGHNLTDSSIAASIKRHYFNEGEPSLHSSNVNYLNKIIELCKAKNVRLYIVATPLNKRYLERIPKEVNDLFPDLITTIRNKNVNVIDLSRLSLPDKCFGDGDHLNLTGANKFSNMLDSILTADKNNRPVQPNF